MWWKVRKLKVGINARILDTEQVRGWSRYTIELIRGLAKNNVQVVLLSDKPINKKLYDFQTVSLVCQKGINYFDWEQRVLPRLAAENELDILHCPIHYGLPLMGQTKKVLTLHDAIDKAFYEPQKSFFKKWTWTEKKVRMYHWMSQNAADAIITVSEHAKKDLIKYYKIPETKINVIYEAADINFSPKNVKPLEEIKRRYPSFVNDSLFYIGGFEDRKNIEGLLKAYAASKRSKVLLLAGEGSRAVRGENVVSLGYVDDEDLPSLYFYCSVFIYPSFYEGFGLQAVEAMQMGKPILVSANTSLREVVAQNECTFDPYSHTSMLQKINWIFTDANLKKLAQESFERAQFFTWQRCVEQTLNVYKKVLA